MEYAELIIEVFIVAKVGHYLVQDVRYFASCIQSQIACVYEVVIDVPAIVTLLHLNEIGVLAWLLDGGSVILKHAVFIRLHKIQRILGCPTNNTADFQVNVLYHDVA